MSLVKFGFYLILIYIFVLNKKVFVIYTHAAKNIKSHQKKNYQLRVRSIKSYEILTYFLLILKNI